MGNRKCNYRVLPQINAVISEGLHLWMTMVMRHFDQNLRMNNYEHLSSWFRRFLICYSSSSEFLHFEFSSFLVANKIAVHFGKSLVLCASTSIDFREINHQYASSPLFQLQFLFLFSATLECNKIVRYSQLFTLILVHTFSEKQLQEIRWKQMQRIPLLCVCAWLHINGKIQMCSFVCCYSKVHIPTMIPVWRLL